jgi:hypothetical protein
MHQEQPMTNFLYRYESTSGLWVQTTLASPVSRPLVEAMNAILSKDGILAYIGTKSKFGQFLTELKDRRETDSTGFWTSLPEHTILATLGLCLNTSTVGERLLVLHGSPRTLMLGYLLDIQDQSELLGYVLRKVDNLIVGHRPFLFDLNLKKRLGIVEDLEIYPSELQDSLSDYSAYLSSKRADMHVE